MDTTVTKTCLNCATEFEAILAYAKRGDANYCSKLCVHKATRKYQNYVCKNCGKEYNLYSGQLSQPDISQRYCSPKCKIEGKQKIRHYFNCNVCGKLSSMWSSQVGKNFQGKYCSRKCHNEGIRKRTFQVCRLCRIKYPTNYKSRKSVYCSRACRNKYLRIQNRDPDFVKKRLKGLIKRPTEPERIVMRLLEENQLPYKYTGDGSVIFHGYNPDFVQCNGKKKIIEVFGDYWHRKDIATWNRTEEGRKKVFSEFGFDTLILWEKEIKATPQKTLQKILAFERSTPVRVV